MEPVDLTGPHVWSRTSKDVRLQIPDPLRVRITTEAYVVEMTVVPDETLSPAIKEMSVKGRGSGTVPTDLLRSIGLRGILEDVVQRFSLRYVRKGNRWVTQLLQPEPPQAWEVKQVFKRRRPSRVPQEEIETAAEVYRAAVAAGRRDATMAVAEALRRSRPTAGRRVDLAREQGLLGPSIGTVAGEQTKGEE